MKKLSERIIVLASAFVIACATFVYAGTADIQFTDPSVKRGQSIDVTIKVKSKDVSLQTADINIHYDPQMLDFQEGTDAEGTSGNVHISGKGLGNAGSKTLIYTLKFLTKQAGTTKITLQTYQVTDGNDNDVVINHKGQSTVKIASLNKNSSNANLKDIIAGPGNMTPDFDAGQLEYNMDVNNDIEKLPQLEIMTDDMDAKYEIKGNENFKTGVDNKVSIVVTAPNGTSKKTYIIHVNRLEEGSEVSASGLSIGDRIWSQKFYVTIQDIDESETPPEGYEFTPKDGENRPYNVWKEEDTNNPDYYIFRGIDSEGNSDYYRYDILGKSIQRYIPDPTTKNIDLMRQREKKATEQYNKIADRYNILMAACICLAVFALVLIIILIVSHNGKGNKPKSRFDDLDDDLDDDYDNDDDDDDMYDDRDNKNIRRTIPDKPIESRRYIPDSDDDLEIEDLN